MSRRRWHCRSSACPTAHGAVLGTLTADGDLRLDPAVTRFRFHPDTRRAVIFCPRCDTPREFLHGAVFSARVIGDTLGAALRVVELNENN